MKLRSSWRTGLSLLAAIILAGSSPSSSEAKGYSSGGGRSYSSSSSHTSSSHSFSSGSGHSFSSGTSHSSSGGGSGSGRSAGSSSPGKSWSSGSSSGGSSAGSSKTYKSGSGKSYSSDSSFSDNDRRGYSSSKSYTAGSGPAKEEKRSEKPLGKPASDSGFGFDAAAARAKKEQTSKTDFARYKESQAPPRIPANDLSKPTRANDFSRPAGNGSYNAKPPPIQNYDRHVYHRYTYIPDVQVIRTRPVRIYTVFSPYSYRPWVTYQDPFGSLFWWWLLDRSIDDQAWWAYHHRYDMDPARYQALLANNQQLEHRVAELEAQQPPRDPSYTPTGLDRDLMYSDQYVNQSYSNRPTRSGTISFWIFAVPLSVGACAFFVWLIWFKRWQTS